MKPHLWERKGTKGSQERCSPLLHQRTQTPPLKLGFCFFSLLTSSSNSSPSVTHDKREKGKRESHRLSCALITQGPATSLTKRHQHVSLSQADRTWALKAAFTCASHMSTQQTTDNPGGSLRDDLRPISYFGEMWRTLYCEEYGPLKPILFKGVWVQYT